MSVDGVLVLVDHIPGWYRSHHLRRFFTQWIEPGHIDCFHFRHRKSSSADGKCCCVVRLESQELADRFVQEFNGKHWLDQQECEMADKASALAWRAPPGDPEAVSLPELRPASCMPNGNVGTPTSFFLQAIQQCKLPPKIISKLKLEFPASRRKRKYASVPLEYECTSPPGESQSARLINEARKAARKRPRADDENKAESKDSNPAADDDTCEEWERHEALHDDVAARRVLSGDVSQQPGTKERLFEEEMEVTWEKGSSGLVFYTDAQFWKDRATGGDFDAETADDWDLDMSMYYERDGVATDRDGQDLYDIVTRGQASAGSAFRAPRKRPNRAKSFFKASSPERGSFERFTKGFGRRIMERQGWKDGQGLGASSSGIPDALSGDGQTNRFGFGYRGESVPLGKQSRSRPLPPPASRARTDESEVIISTIYDKRERTDPEAEKGRRNPDHYLSYSK